MTTPALPSLSSLSGGLSLNPSSFGISASTPATLGNAGSLFSTPAIPKPAPAVTAPMATTSPLPSLSSLFKTPTPLPNMSMSQSTPATVGVKPIIPMTTPAAYAKTNPASPYVTTPSGAQVDAHTGALINPPSSNTPAVPNVSSQPTPQYNSSATTPAVPNTVTGSSTTGVQPYVPGNPDSLDPSTNPLTSDPAYQAALAQVAQYSQMSPAEKAIADQQTNLNSSISSSLINAEGHGQDLPFVTGEQKNINELGSVEGTRLAGLLTNAQAQRQLNLQGATTQLTAAQGQLSALQARNAPITVPFGGTVVSKSGSTIGGGVFGNAGGSGGTSGTGMMPTAGSAFDPSNTVDQYTQMYMQDPSSVSAKFASNPSAMGAIIQRANDISMQQTGQPFNAATTQANITANGSALTQLTQQTNASQTALSTVKSNGDLLLNGLKTAGLNTSQIPALNSLMQTIDSLGADPGSVAQFKNSLTTLQSEYSKLLAGQGATTEGGASRASGALPGNISISDLAGVLDRIVSEGQNTIDSQTKQIASIKQSLSPYNFSASPKSSSNLGTSGGGNVVQTSVGPVPTDW